MKPKPLNPEKYTVGRSLSHDRPGPGLGSAAREPERPSEPSKFKYKRVLAIALIMVVIPIVVIGIWDYKNISNASKKRFGTVNLVEAVPPASIEGSDGSRVNILVVGYSADDPGHAGGNLTDSIMILSLHKENKTGYM